MSKENSTRWKLCRFWIRVFFKGRIRVRLFSNVRSWPGFFLKVGVGSGKNPTGSATQSPKRTFFLIIVLLCVCHIQVLKESNINIRKAFHVFYEYSILNLKKYIKYQNYKMHGINTKYTKIQYALYSRRIDLRGMYLVLARHY